MADPDGPTRDRPVTVGLIGVYHADGGAAGELRYVIGKVLGTAHCALCDITHSAVRRKHDWDQLVTRVGLPFVLLHLNELPPDVSAAVAAYGSPCVLARARDGSLSLLLDAQALDGLGGSVTQFEAALRAALRT